MASIRQTKNKSWQVIIRRQGVPTQHKTFKTKTEAIQWAHEIEHQIDRGNRVDFNLANKITLNDIIDDYMRQQELTINRSYKREKSRLIVLKQQLGAYSLNQLTPSRIALFRDLRLSQGRSPATVVKDLNTLSKVIKLGQVGWGVYLAINPILSVQKPKVVGHRVRRLSQQEETILLNQSSFQMRAILIFAIETGMRLGEILSLTWIDIQHDMAVLKETKNNEIRYVPFTKKVIQLLQTLPQNIEDNRVFYFWQTVSGFQSSWQRFKRRVGLVDLRFHDLRHEAVSRLFEKGLNHMEVAAISGHKSMQILKRYNHYQFDYLKKIMST
jgi:integrase